MWESREVGHQKLCRARIFSHLTVRIQSLFQTVLCFMKSYDVTLRWFVFSLSPAWSPHHLLTIIQSTSVMQKTNSTRSFNRHFNNACLGQLWDFFWYVHLVFVFVLDLAMPPPARHQPLTWISTRPCTFCVCICGMPNVHLNAFSEHTLTLKDYHFTSHWTFSSHCPCWKHWVQVD